MTLEDFMIVVSGKCLFTLSENEQAIKRYDFVEKYSKTGNWTKKIANITTFASGNQTLFIIDLYD